jgi:hypothetical protein
MHLHILQGFLLIAYMFHQTESWDHRGLAVYSVLIVGLFLSCKRYRHLIFVLASIPILGRYFFTFPNLANHSNLSFFLFLLLAPLSLYTLKKNSSDITSSLIKTLRLFALVTYFFAAFHKLNLDFFNPEVSCANDKMGEYLDLLPNFMDPLQTTLLRLLPLIGFLTEAIIPVFLFVPRLRYFGVLFQCGLHFLLAPLGFIDFSSLAMVLSWSFVKPHVASEGELEKQIQGIGWLSVLLVIGLGFFRWHPQNEEFSFFEGLAFAALFAPFVFKFILPNLDLAPITLPRPLGLKLAALFLFVYGFSNYLGLRTAGTFSMFSNLQTEGPTSNHLLLSSNPFKIFSFQEDLVEIVHVSENIRGFYRKMPQPGQVIPRVEFSRMLDLLRTGNHGGAELEVIYNGETRKTTDAARDPQFYLSAPAWQKKLFKFRAVLKEGPQTCAW